MDPTQMENKATLEQALRRANLLVAAAEVSQYITRILDIDELLPKTVDIICDAYDFYYAGVFLVDEAGEFAVTWVPTDQDRAPWLIKPEEVDVSVRGGDNVSRQINDLLPIRLWRDRIVAVYRLGSEGWRLTELRCP